MRICTIALVIASAIFVISGCSKPANETVNRTPATTPGQTAATATPDPFAATHAIFTKNCVGCHGEDGKGGTKTVDGKKLKVPNLTEGHALQHPDDDFVKQITKGGDGMPAFKDKLTPEQINELVRFIRHEFQGK